MPRPVISAVAPSSDHWQRHSSTTPVKRVSPPRVTVIRVPSARRSSCPAVHRTFTQKLSQGDPRPYSSRQARGVGRTKARPS